MKKTLVLLGAAALLVVGCTPTINLEPFAGERFAFMVPDSWQQLEANEDAGEVAYFSDGSQESFTEGMVSVYIYPEYYSEEFAFDQTYCDETYNLITDPNYIVGFSGSRKVNVEFVDATATQAAHCDIAYELFNEDTDEYVSTQYHRQYLFIDGIDEIVIEVASTVSPMPEYMQQMLDSFQVASAE